MTNEVEYWTERLIKEVVLLRTLLMKCLPSAMNETHGAVKRKLNITAKK